MIFYRRRRQSPRDRPRSPNEKRVNDREQCFENRQGNTCSNRFDGASSQSLPLKLKRRDRAARIATSELPKRVEKPSAQTSQLCYLYAT